MFPATLIYIGSLVAPKPLNIAEQQRFIASAIKQTDRIDRYIFDESYISSGIFIKSQIIDDPKHPKDAISKPITRLIPSDIWITRLTIDLLPLPRACAVTTHTPTLMKLKITKASWNICEPRLSSATALRDSELTIAVFITIEKKCMLRSIKIGQLNENRPFCIICESCELYAIQFSPISAEIINEINTIEYLQNKENILMNQ